MTIETKTCYKCGETKPLDEFHKNKSKKDGRGTECKNCKKELATKYHQEHREEEKEYFGEYYQKHKERIKKRVKEREKQKRGCHTMYKNKSCAQYLGVVIAERLCKHLFKDVEMMPHGFPGYDIVCNRGKKINVKAACITLTPSKNPRWQFKINCNTTADFFICVAFDNRTDLNPLHLWMIPGSEINKKGNTSISPPTIHKWDEWKMEINDAQICCTEMKK